MAIRPLTAALVLLALAGMASAAETPVKTAPIPVKTAPVPVKTTPVPVTPAAPKLTAAQRCASLEAQFNAALPLHLSARKVGSAKKLAEEGVEQCAKKKYSLGSRRLVAALADLGVAAKL